jgi:preprotein translocase subunit SecD
MKNRWRLLFILALTLGALIVVWPGEGGFSIPLPGGRSFTRDTFKLGLDLQGGTQLVLQGDMSRVPEADRDNAIKGVQQVIERRINAYGVAEPIIQIRGTDRVIVELPGVKDTEEAKNLIGKTAQLDFRELGPDGQWKIATANGPDGPNTELTGKYFKKAEVGFEPRSNVPIILFEFNDDGARMFADISTRLVGRPLGIFLDGQELTAPNVREPITGGRGQITGRFALTEAKTLVIQFNAGALPVPVSIEQERTVDATLGSDSIRKSLIAGQVALVVVAVFMVLYYRLPGGLASGALLIYTLLTLSIFKLIPVTLTLAGIAAFILSVGMAVDANILIFERMKEELRTGRPLGSAIDAGFARAWTSIRDSNVSTLITCGLLYWFGSNFGASLIMGFALTLGLGVIVSMFSAIFVTRSLLQAIVGAAWTNNPLLFGMDIPSFQPAAAQPAGLRFRETLTPALSQRERG